VEYGLLNDASFNDLINRSLSVTLLNVAVPVSVRQAVLFWALRSPDARPRLNWRRSYSSVLSQVCLGRPPGRRLQFLGAGDMQACRAREWSWDLSARATWPNNFRRLIRIVSDSSGWPVRRRTSKFVTHSDQVMFRIRRRHHWSKASILFSIALVMDHVSAPYKNTGSI